MTHPLEALSIASIRAWIADQRDDVARQIPLWERVNMYVKNRDGLTSSTLLLSKTKLLLSSSGHLSLSNLRSCNIPCSALFGDDGVAASLAELKQCGTIANTNDLLALGITQENLFGPFESPERHARLSPTSLVKVFGTEALKKLLSSFKALSPSRILTLAAAHLYPTDFAVLSLRFDSKRMREATMLAAIRSYLTQKNPKHILFSNFPADQWRSEAGLTDDYFAAVFNTDNRVLVDKLKMLIWPAQ
jgi:hypothetical protein